MPPAPTPPIRVTDEQLLAAHRRGDPRAFEQLVDRYRTELFHFLLRFVRRRSVAEDLFQETFLQVHISAGTFDADRRFKPWLFTIGANKARDFLRRNRADRMASLSAPLQGGGSGGGSGGGDGRSFVDLMEINLPQPTEAVEQKELAQRVQSLIDEMPDHLREMLIFAYFHKFPYRDIAEMLSIPVGTVKSRLHASVATFAQLWKQRYGDEPDLG